jgi:hypothetical protein
MRRPGAAMRGRPLLVLVLAAAALAAGAAPAGAVAPFGPIVTVMPAPAGCAADHVDGDADISPVNGVIRGFANFSGTGCDEDAIWFFGGSGGSWTFQPTPYQGRVLAAGEHSASYVLFSSGSGIHLGKRGIATGAYLTPARQLSTTVPGAVWPQGDVLAGPDHTWWAVWSEQAGAGREFAQTELFQAKTYGTPDLPRTQVTDHPGNDHQPALAFRPGGGAELVFVRDDAFGGGPTHSHVRLAMAPGNSGAWTDRQLAVIGLNYGPSIATTAGPGGHTYLAWIRNQQPFESDDRSGGLRARPFVGSSFTTDVDASGGQVHVAWPESGAGTVLAERSAAGTWTTATVSTVDSRLNPLVLSRSGRATVLMASPTRIYARTQAP